MSRVQHISLVGLFLVATAAPVAHAQDRPVAFIHGLGSTGETWQSAADALQQQLALSGDRPNPRGSTRSLIKPPRSRTRLAASRSSTIAVGHSNGGLVARQWSKMRYLDGLVTLGTPNHGAPLVDNIFHFTRFSFQVYDRILDVFDAFSECSGVWECADQWSWVLHANDLDDWLLALGNLILNHPWEISSTLGLMNGWPVLPQMAVQSPFIQDLNTNVGSEQAGTRVGIVSIAHNWNDAGWRRVIRPRARIRWRMSWTLARRCSMPGPGSSMRPDSSDNRALAIANKMTLASGVMIAMDSIYCRAVSSPNMGQTCRPNDTVVPDSKSAAAELAGSDYQ